MKNIRKLPLRSIIGQIGVEICFLLAEATYDLEKECLNLFVLNYAFKNFTELHFC